MFTACGIMHRPCCRPVAWVNLHLIQATGWQHRRCIIPQAVNTDRAPEDGRNCRPKHFELTGIINKPLLLDLVGCLYYCISDAWSYKHQSNYYLHACKQPTNRTNLPISAIFACIFRLSSGRKSI